MTLVLSEYNGMIIIDRGANGGGGGGRGTIIIIDII